jgi:hypothetical protein
MSKYEPNWSFLERYRSRWKFKKLLAIVPTGWTTCLFEGINQYETNNFLSWIKEGKNIFNSEKLLEKVKFFAQNKGNITVLNIPYSEHSSFDELLDFVSYIKPRKVIPTVVSKRTPAEKITCFFKNCINNRKSLRYAFNKLFNINNNNNNNNHNEEQKDFLPTCPGLELPVCYGDLNNSKRINDNNINSNSNSSNKRAKHEVEASSSPSSSKVKQIMITSFF